MKSSKLDPHKMTKHLFKICEALQLGYSYYYMHKGVRKILTTKERELAFQVLKILPKGWQLCKHPWDRYKGR